jgi:hypothetical protein
VRKKIYPTAVAIVHTRESEQRTEVSDFCFPGQARVARFLFIQHTKTGKYITNNHKIYQTATKYTKRLQNIPNSLKIDQMDI